MKRNQKILAAALLLLLALPLLLHLWRERAKLWAAEEIGLYVLEGTAAGRFQPGVDYPFSRLDPNEDAVQAALGQPSFRHVRPIEEDVVLIMGDAFFQSVSGYLVTTGERELPSLYETGIDGLDAGGQVMTYKISDRLYSWTGGL